MGIRKLIKRGLKHFGYEKINTEEYAGFSATFLSGLIRPATVFDVGVGFGTHELYKAFPEALFILVEPLSEYQKYLDKISSVYNCKIYYKAAGSYDGSGQINIDKKKLQLSSFQDRTGDSKSRGDVTRKTVNITKLDTILAENQNLRKPIVLKVDTEGHELEVLKGASNLLKITDMVIAEVSVGKRFENSYRFEEMISFMDEHKFSVYHVLSVNNAPVNKKPRTRFLDIVFIKNGINA